jgi:hypothetical protein
VLTFCCVGEKTTKDHVREILQSAGYNEGPPDLNDEEHQTRVLAGYKAALHSENAVVLNIGVDTDVY